MASQVISSQFDNGHLCLASSMILNERPLPIRFFYREKPQHKNDTGFRFYSGQESDEFLQTEEAALVAPLDCIVRIDESIKELILHSDIGCVWERIPGFNDWMPVTDYAIPE